MPSSCCVPQCTNRLRGHLFPSNKLIKNKWIVAIRRDKWKPTKFSKVCYKHFVPADYREETLKGTVRTKMRLKQDAIPSVFIWTQPITLAASARAQRAKNRSTRSSLPKPCKPLKHFWDDTNIAAEETVSTGLHNHPEYAQFQPSEVQYKTIHTQTTGNMLHETKDCGTQSSRFACMSHTNFKNDDKGIHFYTGLETYAKFLFVLQTLGVAAYNLNYLFCGVHQLDVVDQFFLVLIKLRRHTSNFELSRFFGITELEVYNLFCTWVRFMSLQWKEISIWPPKDVVRFYCPSDFYRKFPTTRVIIDGTECPVKKPKLPKAQQSTYSKYKNRNTVKSVIGATPGGLVSYVSPAYGGSTSDRQIIERSNLYLKCDSGDSVMADKGFNVQDIFAPHNITINIPTFFSKKNRMSAKTVLRDRRISSKRVHIERIIGLGKTYKILTEPMNSTETMYATDIIFVCFMLCNFRSRIVSSHA